VSQTEATANPLFEIMLEQLRSAFPSVSLRPVDPGVAAIVVPPENLVEICQFAKSTPGFECDYLASVTAIDYLDRIDVIYHTRSTKNRHDLILRVELDRDAAVVPSVIGVWRAADFQEREIYDLMGIQFSGHPDLRRILLYDEFDGHPLLKDWRLPAEPRSV